MDDAAALTEEFVAGSLVQEHHRALKRREIPDKGRGLVLTASVAPGTVLLRSAAFVSGRTRRERLSNVLAQRKSQPANFERMMAMAQMPGICHGECNESLFIAHAEVDREEIYKIMDILGTNDHGPGFWIEPAGANHSCDSNSRLHINKKNSELSIIATRPLAAEEEVTVSYLNKKMNRTSRRITLKKGWGFDCDCAKCQAEA